MQARSFFECATRAKTGWERIAAAIASSRLIFVGETHHQSDVIAFERAVVLEAAKSASSLRVVFEHFAIDQQSSLDSFFDGTTSWEKLLGDYSEGAEGFDLPSYRPVFDALVERRGEGKEDVDVRALAGFIPRGTAREYAASSGNAEALAFLLKRDEGKGFVLPEAPHLDPSAFCGPLPGLGASWGDAAAAAPPLINWPTTDRSALDASSAHKAFFLSLLSGMDLPTSEAEAREVFGGGETNNSGSGSGPSSLSPIDPRRPSRILPAQIIKDLSAASVTAKAAASAASSASVGSSSSKVVVLCGKGHCEFGFGIPERAVALSALLSPSAADLLASSTLLLSCRDSREDEACWGYSYFPDATKRLPAHFIFPFTADPEEEDEDEGGEGGAASGSGGGGGPH